MKQMKRIALLLAFALILSLPGGALAADYDFSGVKCADYYPSTDYEGFYGSSYTYGGRNAIDYAIPTLAQDFTQSPVRNLKSDYYTDFYIHPVLFQQPNGIQRWIGRQFESPLSLLMNYTILLYSSIYKFLVFLGLRL